MICQPITHISPYLSLVDHLGQIKDFNRLQENGERVKGFAKLIFLEKIIIKKSPLIFINQFINHWNPPGPFIYSLNTPKRMFLKTLTRVIAERMKGEMSHKGACK